MIDLLEIRVVVEGSEDDIAHEAQQCSASCAYIWLTQEGRLNATYARLSPDKRISALDNIMRVTL